MLLYFSLKFSVVWSFNAFTNWFVNVSDVIYSIFADGLFSNIWLPIACIKWVFPNPTPPYIKNGLNFNPGASETPFAAACANWLFVPTTNVSNV